MAILARLFVLLPLVLSLAATILAALALFAGHDKGFMESYAIARLNTSMIGHDVFDFDKDKSGDDDDDDDDGFFGKLGADIQNEVGKVKTKIEDQLKNATGEVADELAKDLGISEWYSLHVMDACEGFYKPNATAKHAGLNITHCTKSSANHRFNLTKMLDHELEVGPFDFNLADLNWNSKIQDKLDIINDVLYALFILYALAVALSGFNALCAIGSFLLVDDRILVLINLGLAILAALALLVASIVVTAATTKGIHELNKVADDVGVRAERGSRFLTISWIAAALMTVASSLWIVQFCVACRLRRKNHKLAEKRVTKETY